MGSANWKNQPRNHLIEIKTFVTGGRPVYLQMYVMVFEKFRNTVCLLNVFHMHYIYTDIKSRILIGHFLSYIWHPWSRPCCSAFLKSIVNLSFSEVEGLQSYRKDDLKFNFSNVHGSYVKTIWTMSPSTPLWLPSGLSEALHIVFNTQARPFTPKLNVFIK